MSQSGFTPILNYGSTTASNVPLAANLTTSASGVELAINAADGKLFYKDSAGVVQVLATKGAGTIGGSTTQVQYNNAGALAGSANFTFDGTNIGLAGGTANGVSYLNASKVLTTGSALTFDGTNFGANASIISGSMGTLFGNTYSAGNSQTWLTNNSSASDTYRTTDTAQRFRMLTGLNAFVWETAASGTAGAAVSFSEQMRLTSTGLGIGTTSPAVKLSVNQAGGEFLRFTHTSNNALQANISVDGNGAHYNGSPNITFDTGGTERARIDSSGNFTVGATAGSWASASGNQVSPNFQQINKYNGASGDQFIAFSRNSSTIGSITQTGTTGVLYNVTSDQRLKENIVNAPEFGSVIDSIQVRSYDWITDQTHQRAGFIAQELVIVAPEAVHQPVDSEEMMAVDYSKLVPMLVKEIQSLRQRLAALESK